MFNTSPAPGTKQLLLSATAGAAGAAAAYWWLSSRKKAALERMEARGARRHHRPSPVRPP